MTLLSGKIADDGRPAHGCCMGWVKTLAFGLRATLHSVDLWRRNHRRCPASARYLYELGQHSFTRASGNSARRCSSAAKSRSHGSCVGCNKTHAFQLRATLYSVDLWRRNHRPMIVVLAVSKLMYSNFRRLCMALLFGGKITDGGKPAHSTCTGCAKTLAFRLLETLHGVALRWQNHHTMVVVWAVLKLLRSGFGQLCTALLFGSEITGGGRPVHGTCTGCVKTLSFFPGNFARRRSSGANSQMVAGQLTVCVRAASTISHSFFGQHCMT